MLTDEKNLDHADDPGFYRGLYLAQIKALLLAKH